jgi:hypothetical protein
MKLAEVKHIKVGETDYPVKLTNRALIEYETLTGEAIVSFKGTERLSKLFFCTTKAGYKAEGKPFAYTYEQFLDLIDDFPLDVLTNFLAVIVDEFTPAAEGGSKKKR